MRKLETFMYIAGDLEKLCQGTDTNGDWTVRAGGVVVTGDLVLEGYSVAQLSLYSIFCVRPLSLLFVFLLSPIQRNT